MEKKPVEVESIYSVTLTNQLLKYNGVKKKLPNDDDKDNTQFKKKN